jgi:hypothetical protein
MCGIDSIGSGSDDAKRERLGWNLFQTVVPIDILQTLYEDGFVQTSYNLRFGFRLKKETT